MKTLSKNKFFLPFSGFICGIANGLLGAGGGVIAVYALNYALKDSEADKKDIFANALCVMLPISAVSCVTYAISGNLSISGLGLYALPAILGGLAGGFLLHKIKTSALKKLFSALVIYSGLMLVIK